MVIGRRTQSGSGLATSVDRLRNSKSKSKLLYFYGWINNGALLILQQQKK